MGVVNTTYTFSSSDTITSTKLNNVIDETTFTSDAISGTTLQVTSGKLAVSGSGITSNELASNSVVTSKITDANVTTAKIADSSVIAAKIASDAVTTAKILDSNVTTAKIADANVTAPKLSGAQTGLAPIYGVRAWCNFDATKDSAGNLNSNNTPRLLNSKGNVASVTKISNGNYTVVFSENMTDNKYTVIPAMTLSDDATEGFQRVPKIYSKSVSSFNIAFWAGASGTYLVNPVSGTFIVMA